MNTRGTGNKATRYAGALFHAIVPPSRCTWRSESFPLPIAPRGNTRFLAAYFATDQPLPRKSMGLAFREPFADLRPTLAMCPFPDSNTLSW
jgi:hypothetical protein